MILVGKIEDMEKFMKDLDAKYQKKWQQEGRFQQIESIPASEIEENIDEESEE